MTTSTARRCVRCRTTICPRSSHLWCPRHAMPIDVKGRRVNGERYIHGEIYKARPDVHAVVHSHSQAVIPCGTRVWRSEVDRLDARCTQTTANLTLPERCELSLRLLNYLAPVML